MKLSSILLQAMSCGKFIKNMDIPICKNCIYFNPTKYDNYETPSPYSECKKFGDKNIISGEISYKSVQNCREQDYLCGEEGKYFEMDKNIRFKLFKHKLKKNMPYGIIILLFIILRFMP